jgi:hypothetical protein
MAKYRHLVDAVILVEHPNLRGSWARGKNDAPAPSTFSLFHRHCINAPYGKITSVPA